MYLWQFIVTNNISCSTMKMWSSVSLALVPLYFLALVHFYFWCIYISGAFILSNKLQTNTSLLRMKLQRVSLEQWKHRISHLTSNNYFWTYLLLILLILLTYILWTYLLLMATLVFETHQKFDIGGDTCKTYRLNEIIICAFLQQYPQSVCCISDKW